MRHCLLLKVRQRYYEETRNRIIDNDKLIDFKESRFFRTREKLKGKVCVNRFKGTDDQRVYSDVAIQEVKKRVYLTLALRSLF